MDFLYPNMLYGLFAVAIPILVHLFNFRRYQKVYFSNVSLLKSIHKKTKKQSELKHLLVLFLRILTLIAIVFAFAGPYLPNKDSLLDEQERKYVSIYVDNSFSMTHLGENGSLLNEAQNAALSILDSYENADHFHLITNQMNARHHRWYNKMEMAQNIMEVEPIHLQQSLKDVFQREKVLRSQEEPEPEAAVLYLLSDFQKNSTFNEPIEVDTNLRVRLLPMQNNPVNNLSVDSLWFEQAVQLPQTVSVVQVKLSNYGDEDQQQIPLRLFIGEQQKAVVSVDIPAGESRIIPLSFTNESEGDFSAHIEIEDYPIIYDDRLFFTFKVRHLFSISMISEKEPNPYLTGLYQNDSMISLNTYQKGGVDYNSLSQQDLIIVNELTSMGSGLEHELSQYVENGGQLLVIPSSSNSYDNWLKELKMPSYGNLDTVMVRMADINKQLPFYQMVFEKSRLEKDKNQKIDLPQVKKYYPINRSNSSALSLLTTRGGKCILSAKEYGKGVVYQLAFPLNMEYSTLPEHALFVAVFYQMVLQSKTQRPIYEQIGSDRSLEMTSDVALSSDAVFYLKQGEISWIPEVRNRKQFEYSLIHIEWPNDGLFDLEYEGQKKDQVAVNYGRKESDFSNWTLEELSQKIAEGSWPGFQLIKTKSDQLTAKLIQMDQGISLWKWFLICAIILIFVETLLLRFWK